MGAQLRFGTAGATGGGWSSRPGALQPTYGEPHHEPRWSMQARSPKTRKDRNRWASLWPRGSFGGGDVAGQGYTPISSADLGSPSTFEPFSCDGDGCSINKFLKGTCRDTDSAIVANAIVQGFRTSDDAYTGQAVSMADGTYILPTDNGAGVQHYIVAYKAGSPDIAGTTVNTLTPTNIDG